jgi:hypothetical protein
MKIVFSEILGEWTIELNNSTIRGNKSLIKTFQLLVDNNWVKKDEKVKVVNSFTRGEWDFTFDQIISLTKDSD